MTEDKVITTNGGSVNTQDADFANDVTLAEGVRISVEIGTGLTTTNTTPTLNVDGTGDKTIVRQDGSALAVGDLKEGQYCDFIYAASGGSHIQDKWVWLNSQQDNLFKTVLDIVYPIGHILTTVKSGNPGDSSYFHAGLEFGTWVAFAKGRTIIGLDSGYTPSAATASADDVIQLTFTASEGESGQLHPFGVGDTITTSAFTTGEANVTNGTVTEATANTIKYASSSSISSGATVTIGSGKVVNTAMDTALEAGGASNHTLVKEEFQHLHVTGSFTLTSGDDIFLPTSNRLDTTVYGDVPAGTFSNSLGSSNTSYTGRIVYGDSGGGATPQFKTDSIADNSTKTIHTFPLHNDATVESSPHNNLQPYITTYIWKRTA